MALQLETITQTPTFEWQYREIPDQYQTNEIEEEDEEEEPVLEEVDPTENPTEVRSFQLQPAQPNPTQWKPANPGSSSLYPDLRSLQLELEEEMPLEMALLKVLGRNFKILENLELKENILAICSCLAKEKDLKVTIKKSSRAAVLGGLAILAGSLIGGPVGIAVGGTTASLALAYAYSGQFKSVVQIIQEMNDDQKTRLTEEVRKAIKKVKSTDMLKDVILTVLTTFLKNELKLKINVK